MIIGWGFGPLEHIFGILNFLSLRDLKRPLGATSSNLDPTPTLQPFAQFLEQAFLHNIMSPGKLIGNLIITFRQKCVLPGPQVAHLVAESTQVGVHDEVELQAEDGPV